MFLILRRTNIILLYYCLPLLCIIVKQKQNPLLVRLHIDVQKYKLVPHNSCWSMIGSNINFCDFAMAKANLPAVYNCKTLENEVYH